MEDLFQRHTFFAWKTLNFAKFGTKLPNY